MLLIKESVLNLSTPKSFTTNLLNNIFDHFGKSSSVAYIFYKGIT